MKKIREMPARQLYLYVAALIVVIVAAISAYGIYASNQDTYSPIVQGTPVSFHEFAYDTPTLTHKHNITYVFQEQREWKAFWNNISVDDRTIPSVDLTDGSVVAYFAGVRMTGGYSVKITELRETEDTLIVVVEEQVPGPSCMVTEALTYPHHIVVTDTVVDAKKLEVVHHQETRYCQ